MNEIMIIGDVGALLLALLALRELVIAFRSPKGFPDRGLYWFNGIILALFAAGIVALATLLSGHQRALEVLVSPYPSARYAPEREAMSPGKNWIYVTRDSKDAVALFYREYAKMHDVTFVENDGTNTVRLLLSGSTSPVFITVVGDGDRNVIYYSETGEVKVTSLPSK